MMLQAVAVEQHAYRYYQLQDQLGSVIIVTNGASLEVGEIGRGTPS